MIQVLFICTGNICRSPMAEAVLKYLIADAGLSDQISVDSVGTGAWHVGEPPHRGTQAVLAQHNIPWEGVARQLSRRNLIQSDYLIAMDDEHIADVGMLDQGPEVRRKLHRLLEFAPNPPTLDVPDPYYVGNFDEVYDLIDVGCRGLLAHIRATHQL